MGIDDGNDNDAYQPLPEQPDVPMTHAVPISDIASMQPLPAGIDFIGVDTPSTTQSNEVELDKMKAHIMSSMDRIKTWKVEYGNKCADENADLSMCDVETNDCEFY